jgi:hypothetical protein
MTTASRSAPTRPLGAPVGDPVSVAARNLRVTSELLAIARGLDAAGVPFIVLKGVPLAYRLFGRLEARRIRDNDILVRPADVERAVAALHLLGYEPQYPGLRIGKERARNNQYALLRRRASGGVACAEVHWSAFYPRFFDVPDDVAWGHTQPFTLHGMTMRVFDEPLTLLHLAAHFAQHGFSAAWILRDVAAAWNAWHGEIDRDALLALARDTGTTHVLAFALRAASDLGLLLAPPPATRSWRAAALRRMLPARRLLEPRPEPDHRRRLWCCS